eukprot:sb/3470558/
MTQSQFGGKILISESGGVKVVSKVEEEQPTTPPDVTEESEEEENEDEFLCPVCQGGEGDVESFAKPQNCQHVFCEPCITEWSKNANTCPICRTSISQLTQSLPSQCSGGPEDEEEHGLEINPSAGSITYKMPSTTRRIAMEELVRRTRRTSERRTSSSSTSRRLSKAVQLISSITGRARTAKVRLLFFLEAVSTWVEMKGRP